MGIGERGIGNAQKSHSRIFKQRRGRDYDRAPDYREKKGQSNSSFQHSLLRPLIREEVLNVYSEFKNKPGDVLEHIRVLYNELL